MPESTRRADARVVGRVASIHAAGVARPSPFVHPQMKKSVFSPPSSVAPRFSAGLYGLFA